MKRFYQFDKPVLLRSKYTVVSDPLEVIGHVTRRMRMQKPQLVLPRRSGRYNSRQELSYRKQIARQLRTPYFDGIYTVVQKKRANFGGL